MTEDVKRVFSCRTYGVLRRGKEVLLTRSHFRGTTFVNFPGGGVEIGEAPMDALKREFREETGLEILPIRTLYASESAHLSTQSPIQIVSTYWLVESDGGQLREGGNGDDVLDLFWCDPSRLPLNEMFPADKEFSVKLAGLLLSAVFALCIAGRAIAGPIGAGDAHSTAPTGFPGAYLGSIDAAVRVDSNYAQNFLDALALHVKATAVMTSKQEIADYLDQSAMGADGPISIRVTLGREVLPAPKLAALLLADALIRPAQFHEIATRLDSVRPEFGQNAVRCFLAPKKVSDRRLSAAFAALRDGKRRSQSKPFLREGRFGPLFDAVTAQGPDGIVLVEPSQEKNAEHGVGVRPHGALPAMP